MVKSITEKSIDHSNSWRFSFSFFCDKCGKEWKSPDQEFTGMGSTAVENGEAQQLLWAHEHQLAYEAANIDARTYFNLCPVCGKRVCDDCFDIEESEHGGICNDCAKKQEKSKEKSEQPMLVMA